LAAGQVTGAADLFFEREIPANIRVSHLKLIFETRPVLLRRHRLLGALPIGAFLTTNFDATIERAIKEARYAPDGSSTADAIGPWNRHATVYTGSERFKRFNSDLPMYLEYFANKVETDALVLKIHNDTSDCEKLVLSEASFRTLPLNDGFETFYRNMFQNYHVLLLGFSGQDPNLLSIITDTVHQFAGYGPKDSYLLLPQSTPPPDALRESMVHAVHYDPVDNHRVIVDALERLNNAWHRRLERDNEEERKSGQRAELGSSPPLEPEELGRHHIFEILVPAIRAGTDLRILDRVGMAMISIAKSAAHPDVSPPAIKNRLAQKFHLTLAKADSLWERYNIALPVAVHASSGSDPASILAKGLRQRAVAFDEHFLSTEEQLAPVVRSTVECAFEIYGCALALALLRSEQPSRAELSQVVRSAIARGRWNGIGVREREALSLAIPDLFLRPSGQEAEILTRLAMTATSLGLIQMMPSVSVAVSLIPQILFLDTTLVLPLLAHAEPRYSAHLGLLAAARQRNIRIVFGRQFLQEVEGHFHNAVTFIRARRLATVRDVRACVGDSEHDNLFLVEAARHGVPDANAAEVLRAAHSEGSATHFATEVGRLDIAVVETGALSKERINQLADKLNSRKVDVYGRRPELRKILASNEAIQLLELERQCGLGQRAWFATGDGQLRRVVREIDAPCAQNVLPAGGVMALLDAFGDRVDYGRAYPRLLWNPTLQDELDQQLGAAVRDLVINTGDIRVPIDEAREMAQAEYRKRVAEMGQEHDIDVDVLPRSQILKESVFKALGAARLEQQARMKKR
jgi:hypothetical protein